MTLISTFDGHKNNVMTISWTMPIDFDGRLVLCTGPWNLSFKTMLKTKECVLCIPAEDTKRLRHSWPSHFPVRPASRHTGIQVYSSGPIRTDTWQIKKGSTCPERQDAPSMCSLIL